MPRTSRKQQYLQSLARKLRFRLFMRARRELDDEQDSVEDTVDVAFSMALRKGERKRYLFRRSCNRKGHDRFTADLQAVVSSVDKQRFSIHR